MTNHETAAIEERVARELAAHNWCGGTAGDLDWGKRTPQFRNEYLALARQTIAIVREAAAVSVPPPAPRAEVARVRALHQQYRFAGDDTTDYCAHCNQISGGWIPWPCPTIRALDGEQQPVGPCVAGEQQNETPEAEAHPAEHSWAAELHDPLADEWVPGTRYAVRDRAVNALAHSRRLGPTWKDGSPTERRLVRATTTYTVEPEPEAEARE